MYRPLLLALFAAPLCPLPSGQQGGLQSGSTPPEATLAAVVAPAFQPAYVDDRLAMKDAEGYWGVVGYGQILCIGEDGPRAYAFTKSLCWDVTEALEVERDDVLFGPMLDGKRRLWVMDPTETPMMIERIESLPSTLDEAAIWDAPRLFRAFEETMTELYPFFEVRRFDFASRVKAARAKVTPRTTELELAGLMADCLAGLGDHHVGFEAKVGDEAIEIELPEPRLFERIHGLVPDSAREGERDELYGKALRATADSIKAGIRDGILGGSENVTQKPFRWGRSGGDIGYILITGMGMEEPEELDEMVAVVHRHLDVILTELGDCRAIVLDLSLNQGGYDAVSHAIASHFTDKRRLAYTKGPASHPRIVHEVHVEPWTGERFLGPVYAVSTNMTASAAEIFQLCCRVLPHVKLVGTRGCKIFSDVIPKPLPNGWWFSISAEVYRTPEGTCYEGLGVPVDIPLPIFEGEDIGTSHSTAILELMARIRSGKAG